MLLFFVLLIAVGYLAERWSMNHALDGVSHRHFPDRHTVEPEESFSLITEMTNASRRFVPFVRLRETIPGALTVLEEGLSLSPPQEGKQVMTSSLYLMPRQKWQRSLRCSLPQRGRYVFQGASLQGGDFLGVSETVSYQSEQAEIIVIPARCAQPGLAETVGGFLGERSVNRFLMEDPVLTLGFREYTGREPMKNISWTQSARMSRLMVKNFDYTLEPKATVLLNVQTAHTEGWQQRLEHCFSLARTVCEMLEEQKIQFRFLTNADAAGFLTHWNTLEDGMSQSHLNSILEGLGRATYDTLRPFDAILERAARSAEQGRTHILILPEQDPAHQEGIRRLELLSGAKVLVLSAEEVYA